MKSTFLVLGTLLLLTTCGNGGDKKETSNTDSTTTTTKAPTAPAMPDWYKRFEGTVAGLPVVVHLHKWGENVSGSYYYLKTELPIELNNWSDTTKGDNEWLLTERASSESPEDAKDANWLITLKGDKLTGTWTGAGNKISPIDLQEAYGNESVGLAMIYVADSARYQDTASRPVATATVAMLQPTQDMADAPKAFLEIALHKAAGCSNDGLNPKECIDESNKKFFEEWMGMMREADSMGDDDIRAFHNNHTSDIDQHVVYNDNGWLIVETMNASYMGGAHGNYASTYLNLDWKNQQQWVLTDVIAKRDTAQLVPLLQASARRYFKIGKSQNLSGYLFESKIPVTPNFYITPKGITFSYAPYEIAAYAAGQINLYLPYEEVKAWLTPEFKARMTIQ